MLKALASTKKVEPKCEHEFKKFVQTVIPDNPIFAGQAAHFKVIACPKCKKKIYVDYVVEK